MIKLRAVGGLMKLLTISTVFIGLFFVFQNCGGSKNFSIDETENVSSVGFGREIDYGIVERLCATSAQLEKTINFDFPKPRVTCDWSNNGNLERRDQYFQARIEKQKNLDLPPGAIICSAEFSFARQNFLYDDHFMLLFNHAIIASSYDFRGTFQQKKFGLLHYNWSDMAGMYWDNDKETIFCPKIDGAVSNCKFPGHDERGIIELSYDSKFIQSLMSSGLPENHNFKLVTIGDNDNEDCEHSDMSFDVNLRYIVE